MSYFRWVHFARFTQLAQKLIPDQFSLCTAWGLLPLGYRRRGANNEGVRLRVFWKPLVAVQCMSALDMCRKQVRCLEFDFKVGKMLPSVVRHGQAIA